MTVSTSSQKSARLAERKHVYNKPVRSSLKTQVKAAHALIDSKDTENAKPSVSLAVSALDRSAHKKVIHPNTAARQKSRLMLRLNAAQNTPEAKPEKKKKS